MRKRRSAASIGCTDSPCGDHALLLGIAVLAPTTTVAVVVHLLNHLGKRTCRQTLGIGHLLKEVAEIVHLTRPVQCRIGIRRKVDVAKLILKLEVVVVLEVWTSWILCALQLV